MKSEIAKKIVKTVVGMSASSLAGEVIKNNVALETTFQKTVAFIGCVGIGAAVGQAAEAEIDRIWTDLEMNFRKTENN